MAKVRSQTIRFSPSASPDVLSYNFYYVNTGDVLDYNSPKVDLGNPAPNTTDNKIYIDVSTLTDENGTQVFSDGIYDIGLTAVDDAGNESEMVKKLAVPFDFVAPAAPSNVEVLRQ